MRIKASALLAFACLALGSVMPAAAQTLDRIKETAFIRLGYLDDARPFSFASSAGKPEGYCDRCMQLHRRGAQEGARACQTWSSEYAPVAVDFRLFAIDNARIDLLCSPTSVTLAKRKEASFSIPVFAGGVRAVMMSDAATKLRAALEADAKAEKATPVWRGSPASRVLKGMTFAVVTGTASQKWLEGRRQALKVDAKIEPVADYHTGMRLLQERKVDAFFGDGTVVLAAIDAAARKNYTVLDRQFTHEPYALGLAKGDDDFRAAVDRR